MIYKNMQYTAVKGFCMALGIILLMIMVQTVFAQDLLIENTTISTTETYTTNNSIIAGPNVTLTSTGAVTLKAGDHISFLSDIYIVEGAQLHASTGVTTAIDINEEPTLPTSFELKQNIPNPFNPITKISYQLPVSSNVNLSIYNTLGQKVATLVSERQAAGYYEVKWNATNLAGGVYFYLIKTAEFRDVKKMTLLK
jgi:hypothetical protein